jgi:hypothetical protein
MCTPLKYTFTLLFIILHQELTKSVQRKASESESPRPHETYQRYTNVYRNN